MKKKKLILLIFEELLLTGLFLCVFAMFHHVLPRMGLFVKETEPVVLEPIASEELNGQEKELTPWQIKFSEHFTDEPIWTENSYSSPQVSITISTHSQELDGYPQTWYVADIYVADIKNLQSYVENESYNRFIETPAEELAQMAGALISINGDYCNAQVQYGFYVRNGVMYQDIQTACDICVLYYDGTMETFGPEEYRVEDILEKKPYQVWKFGPELLDDEGNPKTDFNTSGAIAIGNPRSAIGYYEPGHYCFVVCDGRQDDWSRGLTVEQLSQLFADLGCTAAYNLDGGASATMTFNGQLYNRQSSYRELGDILLIKEINTGKGGEA